jgi:hypothetical protein
MRKLTVVLGLLLLVGAAGTFGYRWLDARGGYSRYQHPSAGVPRSSSGERRATPREGGGWRRNGDSRGLSGLQFLEIVIDLLNVVVGGVGIWLAVMGMRTQRANAAPERASARGEG